MNKNVKFLIIAVVAMVVFAISTNPTDLPSVLLVIPFILYFIIVFLVVRLLLSRFGKNAKNASSALIAGLVVVLLALQSLGQLTLRDTVMVILLFGVAFLYVKRKDKASV